MFMDNAMQIINSYNENDATKADLAAANARIAHLEDMVESITIKSKCADCDVEAKNKRMRELLVEIQSYSETYVDLNPRMKHIIDCAKAALEEKP